MTKQSSTIQTQINTLTQSLQAIELLKNEIEQMQTVDFSKYADIIVNLQMGNKYYGLIKHFDDSMLDYCHKKFDKDTGVAFINKFNFIVSKIEKCVENGIAPDSEQGQLIAKEFWQLITEFTGGDVSMLSQLMNFGNAQADNDMQNILNAFIEPALGVYFENLGINPFEAKNE